MNLKLGMTACVAVLVCQVAVSVQTGPGTLEGYVSDVDGGALPGVSVAVSSTTLPAGQRLTTNARGGFGPGRLSAGQYQVDLALTGFKSAKGVVNVKHGAVSTVTFQMAIGSLEEVVTVRAPAPPVTPPVAKPPAQPGAATPIRVGGGIQEPRKIQ